MRWLLLGALLGLLIAFPACLAAVLGIASWLAVQPVVLAFVLGVLARPALARRMRGWAR